MTVIYSHFVMHSKYQYNHQQQHIFMHFSHQPPGADKSFHALVFNIYISYVIGDYVLIV